MTSQATPFKTNAKAKAEAEAEGTWGKANHITAAKTARPMLPSEAPRASIATASAA